MQINQANLTNLFRGFRVIYEKAYQAGDPQYQDLTLSVPSSTKEEIYDFLGAISGMKELIDDIQLENLSANGFTIRNKEWENTIAVKELDILTDHLGIYSTLFSNMGDVAAQHPDELIANLMINGFSTLCYTGKNFFDTGHQPLAKGTSFDNKATYALSPASFDAARTNLKSRLNAKGRPMNLGRKLMLVVSPQNETLGKQILQADFIAQSAKNVAGSENVGVAAVSNTRKGDAVLKVWPQLAANPGYWFLLEVGYVMRPFLLQQHTMPRLVAVNQPNDSYVVLNHKYIYQAYGIYNAGYGMPEFAFGSTGATAAL
jgi:phage major head subunit gpT-like protein